MHSTPSLTLPVDIGMSPLCPQTLPHHSTSASVSPPPPSFLLFIVKVKLKCNSNVEDLHFLFFFFCWLGGDEMCQMGRSDGRSAQC